MPVYHCHADVISKGQVEGGAAGFHQYLNREGQEQARQFRRYIDREHGMGKDDLVASGAANLPRWAQDADHFWQMADTYERKGWVVARTLEIALPRELSPEGRLELAQDLCEVTVGKFTHSWAVHEPQSRDDSGIQPHVHLMYSPRREEVELDRTPAQWFAKAAAHDKDPLTGGVRKDPSVERKARLYDVRAAVALLTNAALAREGLPLAVDHRSLEAQGLSRDPARYGNAHDTAERARTQDYRQQLRASGVTAYEQLATYAGWQAQAVKLLSLDRQYVRDLARDHVWRYDRSPARQLEREQSMVRTLDLAYQADWRRTKHPAQTRAQTQERTQGRDLTQRVRELAARLERLGEAPVTGAALNVRLWDDEERQREQARGIGW